MTAASLRDQDTFVYRFDADEENAFWLARQLWEQWLRERNVRSDAIGDLLLVMTELCQGAGTDAMALRGRIVNDGVEVEVQAGPPNVLVSQHGDLRLAAALCDEVVLRVTPEQTVVLARTHGVVLP